MQKKFLLKSKLIIRIISKKILSKISLCYVFRYLRRNCKFKKKNFFFSILKLFFFLSKKWEPLTVVKNNSLGLYEIRGLTGKILNQVSEKFNLRLSKFNKIITSSKTFN
jgi:hypothetical protein